MNLRLRVQRRSILASDCLNCAAWASAIVTASFDIALSRLGALDSYVDLPLDNYQRSAEDLITVLKVRESTTIL